MLEKSRGRHHERFRSWSPAALSPHGVLFPRSFLPGLHGSSQRNARTLERFPSRYREPTECFPWRAGASRVQVPYIQVKTAVTHARPHRGEP
jgi:hypothetical protein